MVFWESQRNKIPMTWTKKRKKYATRKHYSVISKLEREGRINESFQVTLSNLTLEEVLAVKLELAARTAGGNIYGIPIWYSITDLVRDAMLKTAISVTRTKVEAARLLGITVDGLNQFLKEYKTMTFFENEDNPLTLTDSKRRDDRA